MKEERQGGDSFSRNALADHPALSQVAGKSFPEASSASHPGAFNPDPAYSLILPAYNEAAYLPRVLEALRAAQRAAGAVGEIIVVDNRSTDETAAIARTLGARVVFEGVRQISRVRNRGASVARGAFLVFVDADTLIPPRLLSEALRRLARGAAGGGATLAPDRPVKPAAGMALALWNRFSRFSSIAAGSFIFCRRDAFREVGGFSESVFAGEEIGFSLRLARWGRRRGRGFSIVPDPPVITSVRKMQWYSAARLTASALMFLLFPPAVRSRRLCGIWYNRPSRKDRPCAESTRRTDGPRRPV
jgi:glycosyltransferase involved in cell wall biosynthesis